MLYKFLFIVMMTVLRGAELTIGIYFVLELMKALDRGDVWNVVFYGLGIGFTYVAFKGEVS